LIPASGSAIAIRDVAEEEGLLDSPEPLDRLVLGRLSSLIGARTLSDADLMSILEKFDARDLASAWIGPPALLERMKAQLTPAKAELLDSYLETTKPSREGVAFGRLRLAILQGLDEARKDGDAAA